MYFLAVVLFFLIVYLCFRIFIERKTTSSTCLVGKTAIVTGGNSGLGYATCLLLASRGCKVIIADRDNAEQSRNEMIKKTGNPNIFYQYLDLSSLNSVRVFSKHILETEEKIDILINNAGIGASSEAITEDGLNYVMQVNYFGGFLLTHLLLKLLKSAVSARIIFLGSSTIYVHNLRISNLNQCECSSKREMIMNYCNSKLCNVLAAQEFTKKLKKFNITAFSADPGLVNTSIFQKVHEVAHSYVFRIFTNIWLVIIGLDPLTGAQTIFHLAISDEVQSKNGTHYAFLRPFYKPSILKNEIFCDEIWKRSEELVNLREDEKLGC